MAETPEVRWEDTSLKEMKISPVVELATGVTAIQTTVSALNAIQAAAALLIPATTAAPSPAAAVAGFAGGLAATTAALIGDLRQTGVHLLLINPTAGGTVQFEEHLRVCLLDEGNPDRPAFSSTAYLTAMGVLVDSEDAATILNSFNQLAAVFASTQATADFLRPIFKSAPRTVFDSAADPKQAIAFVEHFFKNQLTNTARPLQRCLWRNQTLEDLLPPEAQKILRESQRVLEGIAAWAATDPLTAYLQFLDRILKDLEAQLQVIIETLSALNNLFVDLNVRAFTIKPFRGGTQTFADELGNVFGPASNFTHTTNSSLVGGVVVVGGSATIEGAEAINVAFKELFNIGQE